MNIESEFSLKPDIIYLNHAAVSPWPERTRVAVNKFAEQNAAQGSLAYPEWLQVEAGLRAALAKLINAPNGDTIALLKNTSEALSIVAYGIDWQAGENIVISNQEFPSNRIVWESLRNKGVEVRRVDLNSGASPEESLMAATDANTRLLSISSVQYATGLRMQLERLGEFCRQKNILFCVDAIQSIGAVEFDVQAIQADFVMADGHKWMLGPEGLALFYCRPDLYDQLSLNQFGWHMVEHIGEYDRNDWQPARSARRFECGSPNMLAIHALYASISLLLDFSMQRVEQHVLRRTEFMMESISQFDTLELVTNSTAERYAGIVSFRHKTHSSDALFARLCKLKIFCACRNSAVRFSPHFYTDMDKIYTAIEAAAE